MTRAHAAVVGREVELGKLDVKPDDRNLQAAAYLKPKKLLPKAPTGIHYSRKVKKAGFPVFLNDQLPDCTAAGIAHAERVFSYNAGSPENPTDQDVLALFDATGPRNQGRYMLDMLNYWRNTGFQGERIYAFVQLDPTKHDQIKVASWLFGGVYVGLALPISAQRQTKWKVVPGPDGVPGSWGGHAIWVPDILKAGPRGITWGELMPMTWGFWDACVDEAYCVISPDWADGTRKAPSGFDLAQLQQDLSAL